MKKDTYIMVCPKCGSADVEHDFSQPSLVAGGIFNYKCNNCGHTATVFPEIQLKDLHKPKNPRKTKKKKLVDMEFGKGLFGILRLIAPLGIIFSFLIMINREYVYFGVFGVFYFFVISIIVSDKKIHDHEIKNKILSIFMIFGVIVFFFLTP